MTPSPAQINQSIAEFCGWYDFGTTAPERGSLEMRTIGRNKERMDRRIIPDYVGDLNAIHEAEAALLDNITRCDHFEGELRHLIAPEEKDYTAARCFTWHATAKQRSLALLRVIRTELFTN